MVVAAGECFPFFSMTTRSPDAKVAELADALDLGSSGATRAGSIPAFRTIRAVRPGNIPLACIPLKMGSTGGLVYQQYKINS
jgi:hypothetical protein